MLTSLVDRWVEALDALGADWSANVVIAGEDAAGLAALARHRGAPPLAAEGSDWVVLARERAAGPPSAWQDFPAGEAGLVVLRRAWTGRAGLGPAVGAAARLLGSGGRLVVADVDVERLLGGSTIHYPYRLRFTFDEEAAAVLRSSTLSPSVLAIEAARAGLRHLTGITVDEERGRFASPQEYWRAARDGGWASLAEVPPEIRDPLLEAVALELEKVAPLGELVERRPWFAATGVAP